MFVTLPHVGPMLAMFWQYGGPPIWPLDSRNKNPGPFGPRSQHPMLISGKEYINMRHPKRSKPYFSDQIQGPHVSENVAFPPRGKEGSSFGKIGITCSPYGTLFGPMFDANWIIF